MSFLETFFIDRKSINLRLASLELWTFQRFGVVRSLKNGGESQNISSYILIEVIVKEDLNKEDEIPDRLYFCQCHNNNNTKKC